MKITLTWIDSLMLSLMIVSLPSVEGPKNIFLVGYLVTRIISEVQQFRGGHLQWDHWDSIFFMIVLSAFLSTLFAGFSGLEEWKGYKVFLTAILTGWLLSRSNYTKNQYHNLFKLIVLSTIPPLAWGLYENLVIHSKTTLEIHSVGHVNHSAIYLVMIFGASLGWFLSQFNSIKNEVGPRWKNILLCILSLLFFISLIIMQSRGAFGIAVLLGLSLLFLLESNKVIKTVSVGVIVGILLLNVTLKTNIIQKQIANSKNNNVLAFRDRVWNVSLEASRFNPVFGIGLSNWHFINLDHLKKSVEARGELFDPEHYAFPGHSHNLYLSALVERGVVGLIVTFFFMGAWIRNLIKTFDWARKSRENSSLWAGSFSAWVATFGVGLVNTTFHHEHGILACLFLGIYLSYTRLYQGKNKKYLSL